MPLRWDVHCILAREISGSATTNHVAIASAAGAGELCEVNAAEIAALLVAERIPSPRMGGAIITVALNCIMDTTRRLSEKILEDNQRDRLQRDAEGGGEVGRRFDVVEHTDFIPAGRTLAPPGSFRAVGGRWEAWRSTCRVGKG